MNHRACQGTIWLAFCPFAHFPPQMLRWGPLTIACQHVGTFCKQNQQTGIQQTVTVYGLYNLAFFISQQKLQCDYLAANVSKNTSALNKVAQKSVQYAQEITHIVKCNWYVVSVLVFFCFNLLPSKTLETPQAKQSLRKNAAHFPVAWMALGVWL